MNNYDTNAQAWEYQRAYNEQAVRDIHDISQRLLAQDIKMTKMAYILVFSIILDLLNLPYTIPLIKEAFILLIKMI